MTDFVRDQGIAFFAHLLRRLSDEFVAGAAEWYTEIGLSAPARTASTLLLLGRQGPLGVTEIAGHLRQSHPLVITWIRQLSRLELVKLNRDPLDARRTVVSLTEAGVSEEERMERALGALGRTYQALFAELRIDVADGLLRLLDACEQEPFAERLRRQAALEASRAPLVRVEQ